jgi:hypothetical protein
VLRNISRENTGHKRTSGRRGCQFILVSLCGINRHIDHALVPLDSRSHKNWRTGSNRFWAPVNVDSIYNTISRKTFICPSRIDYDCVTCSDWFALESNMGRREITSIGASFLFEGHPSWTAGLDELFVPLRPLLRVKHAACTFSLRHLALTSV